MAILIAKYKKHLGSVIWEISLKDKILRSQSEYILYLIPLPPRKGKVIKCDTSWFTGFTSSSLSSVFSHIMERGVSNPFWRWKARWKCVLCIPFLKTQTGVFWILLNLYYCFLAKIVNDYCLYKKSFVIDKWCSPE